MSDGFIDFSKFMVSIPVVLRWIICILLLSFSAYVCWKLLPIHGEIVQDKSGQNYLVLDGEETLRYILFFGMTVLLSAVNVCLIFLFSFLCPLTVHADLEQSDAYAKSRAADEIKNDANRLKAKSEKLIEENESLQAHLDVRQEKLNAAVDQHNARFEILENRIRSLMEAEKNISKAKENLKNQRFKLKRKYGDKFIDDCDSETAEAKDFTKTNEEWHTAKVKAISYSNNKNIFVLSCLIKNKKYNIRVQKKAKNEKNTKTYSEFLLASDLNEYDIDRIVESTKFNFNVNVQFKIKNNFEFNPRSKRKVKTVRFEAYGFRKFVE